jgi:hypothetical protein
MKKSIIASCLLGLTATASVGCCPLVEQLPIVGSRNVVIRTYEFSGFDSLDIGYGFRAEITRGDEFSVEVRVSESLSSYVEVAKSGSTLRIGLQSGRAYVQAGRTLEATVTMPELTGCDVSGGSRANIRGFRSDQDFSADVSGGARLEGDIECGDIWVNASGGSTVILSGLGGDLVAEASGGATANLGSFEVRNARAQASGGGTATVNVTGRLDAEATGGGRVTYSGNPTLGTIESSGGGSVKKR